MGKLINKVPGSRLLISSLPGSASLTMSTCVLKALPGKLDIKWLETRIIYLLIPLLQLLSFHRRSFWCCVLLVYCCSHCVLGGGGVYALSSPLYRWLVCSTVAFPGHTHYLFLFSVCLLLTNHGPFDVLNITLSFQPPFSDNHHPFYIYQSPLILTELFQHNLINVSYLTACYLYQVMMTLHFLNDVANDA